jgi:hypothetical protein
MISLPGVSIQHPPILDSITGFPEDQSDIRIYWMVNSLVKSYSQQKYSAFTKGAALAVSVFLLWKQKNEGR